MKWKSTEQRRNYYRKWRDKNREKRRLYEREYYKRHHPECIAYHRKWRTRHKKESNVHNMIWRKVKAGKILKKHCVICRNKIAEAHHQDYNKPLEIIWLCASCHKKLHLGQLVEEINNYLVKAEEKLK